MKIARVFPSKTSMTPNDPYAYFGPPDLFTPKYDKVYISTTFTWDIPNAEMLKNEWSKNARTIFCGGPAYNNRGSTFTPGFFLRKGIVITSRGCPNNCSFCFVPRREGKIRTLPVVEGNIIQDNNLLACPKSHIDKVFSMLKKQRHIDFSGGFETNRVTDEIVEYLRGLDIYQIWLAYDQPNTKKPLQKAVNQLSKYFKRDKIRCYVLIGHKSDTIQKAENRLRFAYEIGTLPFAMLYKDEFNSLHSKPWRQFQRLWSRPAIIKSIMSSKS